MEIAMEETIVETYARSDQVTLENSMDVEEKIMPRSKDTTESRSEDDAVETADAPSVAVKNKESAKQGRAETGTTSLALLAEAYDSSDSESEETAHSEVPNERARCDEQRDAERRSVEEESEARLRGEVDNGERRSDEEEKQVGRGEEEIATRCSPDEKTTRRSDDEKQLEGAPEIETAKKTLEDGSSATAYRNETRLSSSSDDSDSDSETGIASSSADSDSDEETIDTSKKNERNGERKIREKETKGEYDDLPPIEELEISVPEVLCDPLGEVGWMVEQMVVVKPKHGKPTLNLDTILFVERGRRVLGRIFDVFGQVSEPHYCVRFNSSEHIEKSEIRVGMVVYFCPNTEYTSVVFLNDLLKMKATEEIGDDEHPEFSDDEEERAYYAALRQKPRNEKAKAPEVPQKRQRIAKDGQEPGWRSNHPWSTGKRQQGRRGARANSRTGGGEWPINQERNVQASPNFQQYGTNERWVMGNAYTDNRWHGHPNQAPITRPFFRPVHTYDPYALNSRFPIPNLAWQSQSPSAPTFSWPFPPPPPPPPTN